MYQSLANHWPNVSRGCNFANIDSWVRRRMLCSVMASKRKPALFFEEELGSFISCILTTPCGIKPGRRSAPKRIPLGHFGAAVLWT